LKVSIVVPVYNAGDYLDRCAPSLLEQSLGSDGYEVIYVDDGSTDGSGDRLREITERHPHARLISQENSGWPGKPRNVGIEASTAEYIQFVDQDDELAPDALERMYAVASRNHSDIVLGKMGGAMAKPITIFRESVESATLAEIKAIDSLTGHKMFRRAYLDEHGIRFPEGYWRMEDLLFVTRAYVHNPRLSVVADKVCYWWHAREDGGNNSQATYDLAGNYARWRVIIDTVRDANQLGPQQEAFLHRLYGPSVLNRLNERAVADDPNGEWLAALPHVGALAREGFPPEVRDSLPAVRRLRGLLVEREDAHRLHTLSTRIVGLAPVISRRRARIDADGVFRVDVRFTLALPDGDGSRALTVVDGPDGWLLDPELTAGLEDLDPFLVGDPLLHAQGALYLEDAERQVWWYPAAQLVPALEPIADGRYQVVLSGELSVDPATAAAGAPLPPGSYTVWFIGQILGVGRRRRLVMPKAARRTPPVWTPSRGKVAVRPDWSTPGAKLRLEIAEQPDDPVDPPPPTAAASGRSSRVRRFLDRIRGGGD
jgi:glycosyltransferase involved in cell wall biosynthesis